MDSNDNKNGSRAAADHVAETYFGIGSAESESAVIRRLLHGSVVCAVLVPVVFLVRFGEVDVFGWAVTVFLVLVCLVSAFGLHFRSRTMYHSPVERIDDWQDRVGSLWLVCCAAGPLLGWMITAGFDLTTESWRMQYGLRVALAMGAPVLTALPLLRYVRGRSVRVVLPLLVFITALPVSTAVNVSRDLWEGPVMKPARSDVESEPYLQHTEQPLRVIRRAVLVPDAAGGA